MIKTHAPTSAWQHELQAAVRDPKQLLQMLALDASSLPPSHAGNQSFPCRVPLSFIQRMQPKNPNDPLLQQVLPTQKEHIETDGFHHDPLQETAYLKAPGLIHKYHGRVLLTLTGACAVHCRYCFRQHFDYQTQYGNAHQTGILDYIANDASIHEVILSGGDPLSLNDGKLDNWFTRLAEIPHVKRLRIHSRLPIVIPNRITPALCASLKACRLKCVMVLHINHPNELIEDMRPMFQALQQANVILLNQSVLLRNINDNVETLQALSERLIDMDILPYYLHQFDPVQGGAHFQVPLETAKQLMQIWLATAPGYMVPKWVSDLPHQPFKTPLPTTY